MRRMLAIVGAIVAMTALLTACGKFTCEQCGVESSGTKHNTQIDGKKAVICESCKTFEDLKNDLAQPLN